jgi:lysophospholipid acyltransferase (LPLAT)-like uncharacterized protein
MNAAPTSLNQETRPRARFTRWQRFLLRIIPQLVNWFIRLACCTVRFAYVAEEGATPEMVARPAVYSFWHCCLIPAAYYYRKQRIRVMQSESFDGELMVRVLALLGFRTVRGSSSRGAIKALLGMRRVLTAGEATALTIDGPKGPAFVAKPGPVILGRMSGAPLVAFHIALEKPWVLNSWDRMMIPRPFSRALVCMSRVIRVPEDADDATTDRLHAELQQTLERVQRFTEENVSKVGSAELPLRNCDPAPPDNMPVCE